MAHSCTDKSIKAFSIFILVCQEITVSVSNDKDHNKFFVLQWTLGPCYGPKPGFKYSTSQTHLDRCCLPPRHYTLTCLSRGYGRSVGWGWGNSYIEIDGEKYCDDFVGWKAMRSISINGRN